MRQLVRLTILLPSFIILSCKTTTSPEVITNEITNISQVSASGGGNVIRDGGSAVMSRGLCWSSAGTPDTEDKKTVVTGTTGEFIDTLNNLYPNTTYHVRAYASNEIGTSYGNEVTFTTMQIGIPEVTTSALITQSAFTAVSGGNVISDFSGPVTERGVCWARAPNPTILDYKTSNGNGTGLFLSYISWLAPSSTYYIRAYATNSAGTGYGNEVIFSNPDYPAIFNPGILYGTVSDIDQNIYKTVQIGTQTWMAENLKTSRFNDGNPVPYVSGNTEWKSLTTPGFSWMNNDAGFKSLFGGLYNYYAVSTGKLCPTGWHVPDQADFTALNYYLGGVALSGGKLKESGLTHWKSPNAGATNESGFTALPAQGRDDSGYYIPMHSVFSSWWVSGASGIFVPCVSVNNEDGRLQTETTLTRNKGFSVRCIKD